MINREEYEKYDKDLLHARRSSGYCLCYHCKELIDDDIEDKLWIGQASKNARLGDYSYLYFHSKCFEAIAGEHWIIETEEK